MLKVFGTGVAVLVVIGLVAGTTIGAAAQDEDEGRVAPVMFKIRDVAWYGGGDDIPGTWTESDWGATIYGTSRMVKKIEAGDPRASGFLSINANEDMYTDSEGGPILVGVTSQRLVNDDGAWVGTDTEFLDFTEMVDGEIPKRDFGAWSELVGEGAYDGLTLTMFQPKNRWHGVIMPTGQVPPAPDPVSAE